MALDSIAVLLDNDFKKREDYATTVFRLNYRYDFARDLGMTDTMEEISEERYEKIFRTYQYFFRRHQATLKELKRVEDPQEREKLTLICLDLFEIRENLARKLK